MQALQRTYMTKRIIERIEEGNIVFNHPMQRKDEQWKPDQQSLLIHSILAEYAVPQVYAIQLFERDLNSFSVLDGKQRLTTVWRFVTDGFKLGNDTPSVKIQQRVWVTGEDGEQISEDTTKEYEIAGKTFSELDETLKKKIWDFEFGVIVLTDCTEEEIEEQFYRLNNGTALTKDQKTRVILGDALAAFIDRLEEGEFFRTKASFSPVQRKSGEIQTCILQTLMLVMDYQYKDFNIDTIMEFAMWFRSNHMPEHLEKCEELFAKLNSVVPEEKKPNKLMKKINIPMLVYHVTTAEELGISLEQYGSWIQKFFADYTPECEYATYCGQSSTKAYKVKARLDYVKKALEGLVHGE